MTQEDCLLRLIYASRNLLPPATAEANIVEILATAQRRNADLGITGALLFSADSFVQALEGPQRAVSELFEHIQRDPRHAEVVVLESCAITERAFGDWSMAFAGRRDDLRFANLRAMPGTPACRSVLDLLSGAIRRMALAAA